MFLEANENAVIAVSRGSDMVMFFISYSIPHVKAVLLLEMVTEEGDLHLDVAEGAREVLPPLIISWNNNEYRRYGSVPLRRRRKNSKFTTAFCFNCIMNVI